MIARGLRLVTSAPVTVRDDLPRQTCEAYVAQHPGASSYHRPEWLDVIRSAFGHDTKYLTAETSNGVAGVLPLVFFRSRVFGRFAV